MNSDLNSGLEASLIHCRSQRAVQALRVSLPAGALRAHVSHYWLSLDNSDDTYAIAPDGAVDVVLAIGAADYQVDVFGTTTKRSTLPLDIGKHYLGIRFRPGQSRHFLDAQARELTDSFQPADEMLFPNMLDVAEWITDDSLFKRLDAVLLSHLSRQPPRHSRIDNVVRHIEATSGPLRIAELAQMYCKSRRQLERDFLDVVGLPAKLFTEIVRFQRASALLANSNRPLAQIAAELGYTDQSHFSNEFSRFFGQPPARAREHVAFLQDAGGLAEHNADSLST